MKIALLFPGQGSQKVGMGRAFYDAFPLSREVFERIDETLNEALSRIIFEGDPQHLARTDRAQPALYAVSQAIFSVVQDQMPSLLEKIGGVAGHSLGEYSALTAAHAMTLEEGIRLLRARGESMYQAGLSCAGGMMAVLGMDLDVLERLVHEISHQEQGICVIANDNAPGQIILSGENSVLGKVAQAVKERFQKKVISLDVSGAFHSPLMETATSQLQACIQTVTFKAPRYPLIANVTAQPVCSSEEIPALLAQQVCARVRWRESIQTLHHQGVRTFIELGSGKVLTGLCQRIIPDATCISIQTPQDLEALLPLI